MRYTCLLGTAFGLLTVLTVGCGPSYQTSEKLPISETALTGGNRSDGKPYTTYGPAADLSELEQRVPQTKENVQLSKKIRFAEVDVKHEKEKNQIELRLYFEGSEVPLSFQGSLQKTGNLYVAEPRVTGVPSGDSYDIRITCESENCEKATVDVTDLSTDAKTALIARSERREIGIRELSDSETPNNEKTEHSQTTRNIDVRTTETLYGISYFKMKEPANTERGDTDRIDVEGTLLETNGVCTPLTTHGAMGESGQSCLAGNSKDGELVIEYTENDNTSDVTDGNPLSKRATQLPKHKKIMTNRRAKSSQKRKRVVFIETKPKSTDGTNEQSPKKRNERNHSTTAPELCNARLIERADPITKQILSDCTQPAVLRMVDEFWLEQTKGLSDLTGFFSLYSNYQTSKFFVAGRPRSFATMMKILKEANLPGLISVITLVESGFDPNKTSRKGAAGAWQLMRKTAEDLGLVFKRRYDPRRDIEASTRATARYIKTLLDHPKWKGDFKMAMAAYNWGPGSLSVTMNRTQTGAQNIFPKSADCIANPQAGDKQLSFLVAASYSNQFWTLFKKNMLNCESRKHVIQILSAANLGVSPQPFKLPYNPINPLD